MKKRNRSGVTFITAVELSALFVFMILVAGCTTTILSNIRIGNGNNVLASKSATADKSVITENIEGDASLNLAVSNIVGAVTSSLRKMGVKTEESDETHVTILSNFDILSGNNVGASKSTTASSDSTVDAIIVGDDSGNVQ